MKWVNPPVAFMLHAGVPRLLEAGVVLPGLHEPGATATAGNEDGTTARRVALEAYPGLLARESWDDAATRVMTGPNKRTTG